MKLKALVIKDFKGIENLTIFPDGKNLNISGANETGKTSIYDAFRFLIDGKDSLDRKDFGIKPIGVSGVDVEVEAVLDTATLKKVYKEVWTKKKGSPKSEFTGNTTDYWVNGVPQKQKDYQAYIQQLIGSEERFNLLTNTRFFNESLSWQRRREILLEMCGVEGGDMKDVSDKLKVAKAKQAEINKHLKEIPTRIDEANRALPAIPETSPSNLNELRPRLTELQEKRALASSSQSVADINKQIAEVETELLQVKNQQGKKIQGQISKARESENLVKGELQEIELKISNRQLRAGVIFDQEKALQEKQIKLREEYLVVFGGESAGDTICPTCKQQLPEGQVEEARTTFNLNKSGELERINAEGQANKKKLEDLKAQGDALTREINALNTQLPELQEKTTYYKAEIESLNEILRGLDGLPECCQAILQKKHALNRKLEGARQGVDTTEIDGQIIEVVAEIERSEKINTIIKQREQGLKRIEDLRAEEKRLAGEYEEQEASVYQIEGDMRITIENLEGEINGKFETLNFKLFNQLINGGLEDCCIASSKTGVAYPDMSNSQRIRAGLEVIRTLSKHYGMEAPVFIDNAESCDHLIDMGSTQLISLIVSPADKVLRIEQANIKEEGKE